MNNRCGTLRFLKNVENHPVYNQVNASPIERKDVLAGNRALSALRRRLLIILLSTVSVVCLPSNSGAHQPPGQPEPGHRQCYYGGSGCRFWDHQPPPCNCTKAAVSNPAFENLRDEAQENGDQVFDGAVVREVLTPDGERSVIIFSPLVPRLGVIDQTPVREPRPGVIDQRPVLDRLSLDRLSLDRLR